MAQTGRWGDLFLVQSAADAADYRTDCVLRRHSGDPPWSPDCSRFIGCDPPIDVHRLQVDRPLVGIHPDEPFKPVLIPLERIGSTVPFHPVEKRIHKCRQRLCRDFVLMRQGHQLVIAAERLVAIRAKIDLTTVDLDVPAFASLLEKRLWEMSNSEPSSLNRKNQTEATARFASRPRADCSPAGTCFSPQVLGQRHHKPDRI